MTFSFRMPNLHLFPLFCFSLWCEKQSESEHLDYYCFSPKREKNIFQEHILLFGHDMMKACMLDNSPFTSNCMISQTRLRSAMDGCWPLSKKRPFPFSHTFSSVEREEDRIFSALAAASWFDRRPRKGASTVFRTKVARKGERRTDHKKMKKTAFAHYRQGHLHPCSKSLNRN